MNAGKTLFSQLMDCLPWSTFTRIVARYHGDHSVQTFPCTEQYRAMAFAQLTYRESLRDIEACLSAQPTKLWHMGFGGPVRRRLPHQLGRRPSGAMCDTRRAVDRTAFPCLFRQSKAGIQVSQGGGIMADAVETGLSTGALVAAAGALGAAAFALVDASKVLRGGVSNCGFGQITRVVDSLIPPAQAGPAWHGSVKETLRANWLNGTPLMDQKAIAKSLIKLRLDPITTPLMARRTGVDEGILAAVAANIATGTALTPAQQAVYGQFDFVLTAMLDEGYQRADQIYRNSAKALSVVVSVVLALIGAYAVAPGGGLYLKALLLGLVATPLAPITKDLSSALAAGVKAAQLLRR
jgi:Domain of unknown function (DUF4372)